MEDWLEFLDKGYFIGVVTLDLQKGYDHFNIIEVV